MTLIKILIFIDDATIYLSLHKKNSKPPIVSSYKNHKNNNIERRKNLSTVQTIKKYEKLFHLSADIAA